MKGGWITLPRRFFDGPEWRENRKLSKAEAELDLYQRAQWDPGEVFSRGKLIRIERGEQVASCRFLAERWGWSKDTVARFLNTMEVDSREGRANYATTNRLLIRSEVRQGETVLILCNYEEWTLAGMAGCDAPQPQVATQLETKAGIEESRGRDKAKEGKEDKESKNQTNEESGNELFSAEGSISEPPAKPNPFDDALAEIWDAFHRRGRERSSKEKLRIELRKLKVGELPPRGTFKRALETWKASADWTKKDGEYVPGVHRWIAERKWEIEAADIKPAGPGSSKHDPLSPEELNQQISGRLWHEEIDRAVKAIWEAAPIRARESSSEAKLAEALEQVGRELPETETLLESLELWRESDSWNKDNGQWIPGIHKWAADKKWMTRPTPQKQFPKVDLGGRKIFGVLDTSKPYEGPDIPEPEF